MPCTHRTHHTCTGPRCLGHTLVCGTQSTTHHTQPRHLGHPPGPQRTQASVTGGHAHTWNTHICNTHTPGIQDTLLSPQGTHRCACPHPPAQNAAVQHTPTTQAFRTLLSPHKKHRSLRHTHAQPPTHRFRVSGMHTIQTSRTHGHTPTDKIQVSGGHTDAENPGIQG